MQPLGLEQPRRVVIARVSPEIDAGRYPVKRVVGEPLEIQADIFADGHDALRAILEWRKPGEGWQRVCDFQPLGNDRWRATLTISEVGRFEYRIVGWADPYRTWRAKITALLQARTEIALADWEDGVEWLSAAARVQTSPQNARILRECLEQLTASGSTLDWMALDRLMEGAVAPRFPTRYPDGEPGLPLWIDPRDALFSAWYELFPRSAGFSPNVHGTFADVEQRLPHIARMGFDVLYLPPIHPLGQSFRKGRHNAPSAQPGEPGSPWAIGGEEGGHTAVHPQLGTVEDFDRLVAKSRQAGLAVAMDLAFQCSPDHPWVKEHPEWFRRRPDGSIHYAENPPKKYEDIYPFDFECEAWPSLWEALRAVVEFWIAHGIRWFRVDNPHTKSLYFWEWLIRAVKEQHPEVLFLAEAFTRPAVMQHLAKVGFSQSYTYFTWRNTAAELRQYVEELTTSPVVEYLRPNFWPNTPDILPLPLQIGGRPAFIARLVLAATLSASYGIYGPVFELMVDKSRGEYSEEYEDSEKYRIGYWDWDSADSLADVITVVNRFRHDHPALGQNRSVRFHAVDNEHLLVYSKASAELSDLVLMVVNLDFQYRQSGFVTLLLDEWGIDPEEEFVVADALTGERYLWKGPRNYVELDPGRWPAHLFTVTRTGRTERVSE